MSMVAVNDFNCAKEQIVLRKKTINNNVETMNKHPLFYKRTSLQTDASARGSMFPGMLLFLMFFQISRTYQFLNQLVCRRRKTPCHTS